MNLNVLSKLSGNVNRKRYPIDPVVTFINWVT